MANHETMTFGGQEWLVLEKQGDKALLLLKHLIQQNDFKYSDYIYVELRWENNPLRAWLNDQYYNSFSASDRERILLTELENAPSPWYGINGGSDTKDHIFFLSLWDLVKYFGDSGQLAKGDSEGLTTKGKIKDQYDKARIATDEAGKKREWMLRTIGWEVGSHLPINYFVSISKKGVVMVFGYGPADFPQLRPAMWVKI